SHPSPDRGQRHGRVCVRARLHGGHLPARLRLAQDRRRRRELLLLSVAGAEGRESLGQGHPGRAAGESPRSTTLPLLHRQPLGELLTRGQVMKFLSVAAAFVAFGLGTSLPLRAQDAPYRLIVNSSNPVGALSRDEVSKLFLKKVPAWHSGEAVVPVDQSEDAEVRRVFSK